MATAKAELTVEERAADRLVKEIAARLGNRSIRVTRGDVQWRLRGDGPHELEVRIPRTLLETNLQKDGPSAPTFALVLAYWAEVLLGLKVKCVVRIDDRSPAQAIPGTPEVRKAHLKRALIVLDSYRELFGLEYSPPAWKWPEAVVVNAPLVARSTNPSATDKKEKQVEKQLAREPTWAVAFGEGCTTFNNQLPVGLFEQRKSSKTRLTPGQGSQIDLWGDTPRAFHAFELKVGDNVKVGLLSQAFFYGRLLQWVSFGGPGGRRFGSPGGPLAGLKDKPVRMWLAVSRLHPLLCSTVGGRVRSPLEWFNRAIDARQLEFGIAPFAVDQDGRFTGWSEAERWPRRG